MNFINVCEVGPRDGLQSIDRMMPLKAKQAWIKAEFEAGVKEIEVGSFVSPKMLPQMSETTEVVKFAKTLEGLEICVLVPNLKGAEMAIDAARKALSDAGAGSPPGISRMRHSASAGSRITQALRQ